MMVVLIVRYKGDDEYYRHEDIDAFIGDMVDTEKTGDDIDSSKLVNDAAIRTISAEVINEWIEEYKQEVRSDLDHERLESMR